MAGGRLTAAFHFHALSKGIKKLSNENYEKQRIISFLLGAPSPGGKRGIFLVFFFSFFAPAREDPDELDEDEEEDEDPDFFESEELFLLPLPESEE